MPATTQREDLLKHFGTRYPRVVRSRKLALGLGVRLTDELFIKIEYNRPPEAATNHGAARHDPAAHKACFHPSFLQILSYFDSFALLWGPRIGRRM
ncbi:unnamed protein product [Lasius platythorax]|uniref:Uncharacterized protein n=1 Tax=Lasius platythorax TaxID=488582 RepID=A0AAV2NEG1_9HYME